MNALVNIFALSAFSALAFASPGACGLKEHQAGAILDGDQLHDDLQCGVGELPVVMRRSRHSADGRGDDDQQRDRQHGVPDGVHDLAAQLSDLVRARTSPSQ